MNIYKPVRVPLPPPMPWNEDSYTGPIPEGMWNDGQLRRGIEHAVYMDEQAIYETTKALVDAGLEPIPDVEVTVAYPFIKLPVVYTPGCLTDQQEHENKQLKIFAHDAYEALMEYFGSVGWSNWFIAPYFTEGDDTRRSFRLGVFIDENFNETVVE